MPLSKDLWYELLYKSVYICFISIKISLKVLRKGSSRIKWKKKQQQRKKKSKNKKIKNVFWKWITPKIYHVNFYIIACMFVSV